MGSLTCAQIWVCAIHMKGESGTNNSAQELTRGREGGGGQGGRKSIPHLACLTRRSNPETLGLNSDALTTELRIPR